MIKVISGDIGKVEVDALLTPINSGGAWFGGIDGVIQRAAGGYFHKQAADAMPLKNGMTVVARGPNGTIGEKASGATNKGGFKNVVFVVDDLLSPLREIIEKALQAADEAGFTSVSVPTMRMGVMAGLRESKDEAIKAIASTVKAFNAKNIRDITIVVYNDADTVKSLNEAIAFGNN